MVGKRLYRCGVTNRRQLNGGERTCADGPSLWRFFPTRIVAPEIAYPTNETFRVRTLESKFEIQFLNVCLVVVNFNGRCTDAEWFIELGNSPTVFVRKIPAKIGKLLGRTARVKLIVDATALAIFMLNYRPSETKFSFG